MIDAALRTRLLAFSGLTALVSTRVHAGIAPQGGTLPAVVYRRISANRELVHSGVSGVARSRFQFDCLAKTPLEAKQVAAQVRKALHGYSGTIGGETIMRSEAVNETDAFDADLGAAVFIDFFISYRES
jgi:hypothetical protein